MRRAGLLGSSLTGLLLLGSLAQATPAPVRRRVLVTPEGEVTSLTSMARGRPLAVVVIKGHWSEPCRETLAAVAGVATQVERMGGVVVGLDTDAPRTNADLVKRLALPFPMLTDPDADVLRDLHLWSSRPQHPQPRLVFLDRCGELALSWPAHSPGQADDALVLDVMRRLTTEQRDCQPLM